MKIAERYNGIEISEIRKMNALAKKTTINLGIGQLPNLLPNFLREAGGKAFIDGKAGYTSNIGDENLRKAIIKEFNEENALNFTENNVIITNGSQGSIWNVFSAYIDLGDKVLLPNICFSAYETVVKIHGGTVIFYKLTDDFQIDLLDLQKQLKLNPDTKFVLINSPSNPCGSVFEKEKIKEFCEIVNEYDCCVISDEVYNKLYFGEKPHSPAMFAKNFIIINAISKRCAATGLRIGWAITKEEIIKRLIIANQYTCTCANSISQLIGIEAFSDDCLKFCKKIRDDLGHNANLIYETLNSIPKISAVKPQGAFYCMPDVSYFGNSKEVAVKLLETCDILTIPGIAFGINGDKYIRISFAAETDLLKIALKKMKAFFN
ncbi:MAG: aminotransferase class I/II-fold pyridoxal phosphate-dependent enzyme [Chitinispirillales bacterium]|jgi:aspartate/methionine/tyrosine aminotransferase|nr:aminotransferase class I/II-fold pyridoxal phosphate-dependent enzyme [Chitinispirillales bacterium]